MAAPARINTLNITGKFQLNKAMSDKTDEILRLQGVGWIPRKAIQASNVLLSIDHYSEDGVEKIDIEQSLVGGGAAGGWEYRVLDWQDRPQEDGIFGPVIAKFRRTTLDEITDPFLKEGWTEETQEHGILNGSARSNTEKSGISWFADQVWGFEIVDGEKRYTRRVVFKGPNEEKICVRLVYDYKGLV
ncbi:hypothetical protein NLI96_g3582 [Meripilus lineatus]|uniref:LCCL domain-containing protein n=1 Tax=Meripilus lineatus TaxID=2056292 RepID=A0AAD5YKP9_9APHY|nr:hypothetical protein NLI96_g3582 [Physisporinus lineatus]